MIKDSSQLLAIRLFQSIDYQVFQNKECPNLSGYSYKFYFILVINYLNMGSLAK